MPRGRLVTLERPLRTLIVDDEQLARERLADMLADVPAVCVIGEARTVMPRSERSSINVPSWFSSTCRCRGSMASTSFGRLAARIDS